MSKQPRRAGVVDEAPETVDPWAEPGSYLQQADGSYVRTDTPTAPAAPRAPQIPAESAQAIATALTEVGHDVPAVIAEAALAPAAAEGPAPAPEPPASAATPEPAPQTAATAEPAASASE